MSPQTAHSAVEADSVVASAQAPDPGLLHELDEIAAGSGPADQSECRAAVLAPETEAEIARWLAWQCQMLAGVQRGVVFLNSRSRAGSLDIVGVWPPERTASRALRNSAERAVAERRSVIKKALDEVGNGTEVLDYVGQPLMQNGKAIGAIGLALDVRSEAQRRAVLQLLEWGVGWLDVTLQQTTSSTNAGTLLAHEAIEQLTRDYPLPIVAHELCNLLADRLDCARVAIGLADGLQVHLLAMSHQVRFDRRVNRVAEIESAMEECTDQDLPITVPLPPEQERRVIQAHKQLLRNHGDSAVCSIPLKAHDRTVGALSLIREGGQPFESGSIDALTQMASRLAPVLALKQREARSVMSKTLQGIGGQVLKVIGGGHVRTKLMVAFAVALIAGLLLIQVDMKVTARSTIEGRLQQVIAAPFAGYIRDATVRAGDAVISGQVLAEIDDRELLLEQEKLASERDKQRREYQEALATRERAKVSVIRAQIEQTEARLDLIEDKLSRTALKAPFSGTVVSGDLSRSLGAPVERGQALFELVPDEGYRATMQVDEFDVALLDTGQTGSLRLAGLPHEPVPVAISRIVPIADAVDGGNRFRVEGELLEPSEQLRPGMQGVAKLVVGQGSLLRVWSRELVQRLQLWAWSIGL